MNTSRSQRKLAGFILWLAVIIIGPTSVCQAQWTTQQLTLTPGWNAVFLEVQPQPADADLVFGGLPVESAWEWNRLGSPVQFIQDPSKMVPKAPEWATWFPATSPERFLANLFEINGGRAYLIKVSGTASVLWSVKGIPTRPEGVWKPDSFNLAGFFVASSGAPTFATYFAASTAHSTNLQVFGLSSQGKWVSTPVSSPIQRGKAYWVKTVGASDYAGPVTAEMATVAGMDFGDTLEEADVTLLNKSVSTAKTVTLQLTPSEARPAAADTYPSVAGDVTLYYRDGAAANAENPLGAWTPMTGAVTLSLPGGSARTIRLATKRSAMPGSGTGGDKSYQSLLRVSESGGTRQDIPIKVGSAKPAVGTTPRSGLWVGTATLDKVSWAVANKKLVAAAGDDERFQEYKDPTKVATDTNPAGINQVVDVGGPNVDGAPVSPDTPLPTKSSEFQMRLILHVDASGQVKLLQRVIQVWENGTTIPDPQNAGYYLAGTPGKYRLFSNEEAAKGHLGSTVRGGIQIPKRMSTAAFPLTSPLSLTGSFGSGTISGNVHLGYDDPLNPFVHKFHPQHDNLNARFEEGKLPPGVEALAVSRLLSMEFTPTRPNQRISPGWGESELGGIYKETITGIHRNPLHVSGTFILRRVSSVPQIDQP